MSMPRTSFYIRGPKIGPVHTIFHLGSIGTGSRKTLSGPLYHAHLKSQSGQVYRCEHNHRTESAAIKCANSKATQQARPPRKPPPPRPGPTVRQPARRGHFWNRSLI